MVKLFFFLIFNFFVVLNDPKNRQNLKNVVIFGKFILNDQVEVKIGGEFSKNLTILGNLATYTNYYLYRK